MSIKVMVVDDQPLEGDMISFVLNRDYPEVTYVGQALTAKQGVALLEESDADLVFLDIEMPGMDGITAIEHLRNVQPLLHIIILTAFDDFSFVQRAVRAGANDYLLKPIRAEEIVAAVKRASDHRPLERLTDVLAHSEPASPRKMFAQELIEAIQSGFPDEAELAARQLVSVLESGKTAQGISVQMGCIEVASTLLRTPRGQSRFPEGLSFLYQELVRGLSDPRITATVADQMVRFSRECADLFGHSTSDVGYRQVAETKKYVEEHLRDPITLRDIAQRLFLSTAYFSRLFKEKTGENFSSYLAKRRVEHAKQLLATSDLPISEVAEAIGYQEANSFSRLFKASTGISPSAYRTSQRKTAPEP